MPTPIVTNEQIVKSYLEAHKAGKTLSDLANTLGMKYSALYARVKALRDPKANKFGVKRAAVKLPDLTAGQKGHRTDISSLNAMIEAAMTADEQTGDKVSEETAPVSE